MSEVKRVTRNSIYNFLGSVLQKAITLVLIIMMARYLGAEDYGKLSFVIGFTGLFSVVGGFGFHILIRRMVSRDKKKVNYYVSNAFAIKAILNALAFLLVLASTYLLQYPADLIPAIIVGAFFVVFSNLTPFRAVFEAFERMELVFWTRLAKYAIRLLLVFLMIQLGYGVFEILIIYAGVELLLIVADIILYHFKIERIRIELDTSTWLKYVKMAAPFGVAAILMTIDDKIDITMLSKLVPNPNITIGWYSSAYEFMMALAFLPGAISGALAPIAYRAYENNIGKLKQMYGLVFRLFLAMAIPLAIGGTLLAEDIIFLIYGPEFTGSVIALKILIWNTIFYFEMFALGLALNSMNLERVTMKATFYSVLFNFVANLILIPYYSYIGASAVTIGSSMVYFVYCFRHVQKRLLRVDLIALATPILLSGTVMGAIIYMLRHMLSIFILIPVGALVYVALLLKLKVINNDMIRKLVDNIL